MMTHQSYVNGNYFCCGIETGLRMPDWEHIGKPWGLRTHAVNDLDFFKSQIGQQTVDISDTEIFVLKISPARTCLPKISSRVLEDGNK
jgi:hypothetical protein